MVACASEAEARGRKRTLRRSQGVISRPTRDRNGVLGRGLGFVLAALFLASLATPAHAAAPTDSLWQKAVVLAGNNARWVPGTIYTRVEEVDDAGKPKHVHEAGCGCTPTRPVRSRTRS
jgi:hypothetical protein